MGNYSSTEQTKFDYESALLQDKIKIDKTTDYYKTLDLDNINSSYDIISKTAEKHPNNELFGIRKSNENGERAEYVWDTYAEGKLKIDHFACGLADLLRQHTDYKDNSAKNVNNEDEAIQNGETKIDYNKDTHANVGIYSVNRPEWMTAALAIQSMTMKAVPLYDTFGKETIAYIIDHAYLEVVVSHQDKVKALIESKKEKNLNLKVIIQMDYIEKYNNTHEKLKEEDVLFAEENGIKLIGFSEVISIGKNKIDNFYPERPKASNLMFIMYTSGTSGVPKGVMLTHGNAMSVLKNGMKLVEMCSKGKYMSYLPLAHIFEMAVELMIMVTGSGIGYFSGNIKTLKDDIIELRPDYMCGVPRVFERIFSKIIQTVENTNFLKRYLFNLAVKKGSCTKRTRGKTRESAPLDGIIWSKLRQRLGFENLKILITGGAPCPNYLMEFLRMLSGTGIVLQGYGLTETFAVVALSNDEDPNLGHVGAPVGCELRFEAVEDTDYTPDGEFCRGEILVRGENVFVGYFRNEALTREVLVDGWFHTGDVGRLNPNGTLSLIDRKKCLFKLSQGEYISPEMVEFTYSKSPAVNQLWAFGDSMQNFIVAVVVPDLCWVKKILSGVNVYFDDTKPPQTELKQLGEENRDLLNSEMMKEISNYEEDLKRFEVVKKLWLEFEVDDQLNGFNVENDCLTPSFKLRRLFLKRRYEEKIALLYS